MQQEYDDFDQESCFEKICRRASHFRTDEEECSIRVKPLLGRNSRGKAIAGPDSSIGWALWYLQSPKQTPWMISIYSGERQPPVSKWKAIGPLSQVIHLMKFDPDHTYLLPDKSPVYHFIDLISQDLPPQRSIAGFERFNEQLRDVFHNISRG